MKFKSFDDDAVVITGISGRFPKSDDINELMANLMNGEDCVSSDHTRWKYNDAKVPSRIGIMSQIEKFDNVCFGINARQTHFIDPVGRMAMEITFEAITDSGINPVEMRNTKTNVYAALSLCESDKALFYEKMEQTGHNLTGCCRGMMSNRISFCMNLIGSSCTIDSTCSTSALAIQRAYEALKSKNCDYAIVSSGIISLHPQTSYQMSELGVLSPDGVNRSFDDKASGFSRSESVATIILQRAKNAKRIYAEVVNSNVMYGESIPRDTCFFPTAEFQAKLMKQTLKHCGLKPSDISYIEADGTAVKLMDREELKAIDLVYGQNRSPSDPLLIGSIKSNIGHTLNNNAINSIIKVLMAMETGVLPPNLYYDEPPEYAKCLQDGRVKVVTKPTPWTGDYAAVNTAALNGSFSHIILRRNSKEKRKRELSAYNMPRLFVISCRSQEMISSLFNVLKQNREDDELSRLIDDITEKPFTQSLYSGYIVIPESEVTNSEQLIEITQNKSREIWFVFSGMGSQWSGMGESLMKIPIFAEAIKRCDIILRPRGYDITHIICDKDPKIYDNIINCFLGIAAIQIGLVDILYAVGVQPDYMIGHSVGELGCSYADGCFTTEEMILSALSRGLASVESDLIHGTMAAIGLGYQEVRHLCPEDIDVACHNGIDSSTISGPTESINAFVKELQSKGIFAKTVSTNNIAYHSRYISPAGPKLLNYLKKVIPHSKERSKRWLSTSIPQKEWHSTKACLSSAEYHTNNLLYSVLFEEVLKILPNNAVTIEISPHGLLQAILKKSLDRDCINLSLTKRGVKDNSILLLSTLGKLYNLGFPITPKKLYPTVPPYPVSRGTPSISSLFQWEHSSDWFVSLSITQMKQKLAERKFLLNLESDEYKFLRDFKINDNVIIPSAFYLKLVVNMYSALVSITADKSIILENILIHNKLLKVPRNGEITLSIMIFKVTGKFEVKTKEEIMIASGDIRLAVTAMKEISEVISQKEEMDITKEDIYINEEDIYTNLLLRGYQYGKSYNVISRLSTSYSNGRLKWNSNWSFLLEGLIQVHIINSKNKNILMPCRIQKFIIDLNQFTEEMKESNALPVKFEKRINAIACPGITISGIKLSVVVENKNWELIVNELRFIQNVNITEMDMDDVCNVILELMSKCISKNTTKNILITKESECDDENILESLKNSLQRMEEESFNIKLIARELLYQKLDECFILIIVNNAHFNDVRQFINACVRESILLTIVKTEDEGNAINELTSIGLNVVLKIEMALRRTALLLQKERKLKRTIVVKSQENCIDRLKNCLRDSKYDNVIFLVNTTVDNDILKTLEDIKQEQGYKKLQILDVKVSKPSALSLKNQFYEYQMKSNLRESEKLSFNGARGRYKWMPLPEKSTFSSRWRVKIEKSGSLKWIEELPLIKEKNKCVVKVKCAALDLNIYEDCLKNDVSLESKISIVEYSGTDENGRRVMGLVDNFTISNEINPDPDFTWIIPDNLSFEDAATIPQAYLAAFCILHSSSFRFKLIKTVLVHFGASDVGQALINLSLSYHFDVYTTYETEAERRVIESIRPRLPQSHIINITNYNVHILNITKGEGFDFVVASYSILDNMEICMDIVKAFKHLVILYHSKGPSYNRIALGNFDKHMSMYGYCLQDLIKLPQKNKKELTQLMKTALQAGTLKPIISRRLKLHGKKEESMMEVCERYGKILINIQEEKKLSDCIPQFFFRNDKCYFVIEGFNTFGKVLIEWMIEQGVRKLFLVSNKSTRDYENWVLKWRESGATVIVRDEVDTSEAMSFNNLLTEAASLCQLEGIFDLQRTMMDSSVPSDYSEYSKITEVLDKESRKRCPSRVKFFVFSSLDFHEDGLRDPVVEKLCNQRKESGLHGLYILLSNYLDNTIDTKTSNADNINNIHYTKMSSLLQRLSVLLSTDASIIAVHYEIDHGEDEPDIVADESDIDKEEESIKVDPKEEEMRLFEQYLFDQNFKNA